MTKRENLLLVAMEESAELSQALSKLIRFGRFGTDHVSSPNWLNVATEYYQLQSVIEKCFKSGILTDLDDETKSKIKEKKIVKIEHYQAISTGLGLIND